DAVDSPRRSFSHRSEAGASGAAKQVHQNSFDQVVSVMRNEDRCAVSTPCGFSKECVARFTRRSFDRDLLFVRECTDICRSEFKLDLGPMHCKATALVAYLLRQAERLPYSFVVVALDQLFNKPSVGIARSSA